jgi:hypothetical protein
MSRNLLRIGPQILGDKIKAHIREHKVREDGPGRFSKEFL